MSEEASNATKAVPYGILMSIGSCWLFGFILVIVLAACMDPNIDNLLGSKFGQPMAQIYYDAIGKHGAIGLMTLLFIVQFLMGLSILVAVSRQTWAFSRDGALPFSRFIRPVSTRLGHIPFRAIWFCVALAAILGLLSLIAPAAALALFSLAVAGPFLFLSTSRQHLVMLTEPYQRQATTSLGAPRFSAASSTGKRSSSPALSTPGVSACPSPGPPLSSSYSVLSSPCSPRAVPIRALRR